MFSLKQIFLVIIGLNVVVLLIQLNNSPIQSKASLRQLLEDEDNFLAIEDEKNMTNNITLETINETNDTVLDPQHELERQNQIKANNLARKLQKYAIPLKLPTKDIMGTLREANPFHLLGFYKPVEQKYFNSYPLGTSEYDKPMYGLTKDPLYCDKVDLYNIMNPLNIFEKMNFFTDYSKEESLIREKVMREIGVDTMPYITKFMNKTIFNKELLHMNETINMFFTKRVDIHIYNELGKNFGCATQMYNHIPGHGVLKRKDLVVDSVASYAKRYKEKPQCFNKQMFFPFAYRLYIEEECKEFFNEIYSEVFIERSKTTPIQYIIKIGYGAHRASGVFLLDDDQMRTLKTQYGDHGELCGKVNASLVAQKYIENALLLDKNNKFDFRIYMLIASTDPFIVYYHDGFLRVSLKEYNQHSNDRSVHLTNTHLAKQIFKDAKDKQQIGGMNETELRDYQMWTMEDLHEYLMLAGKVADKNWLDNYLRPAFMKAFIHTVRMSESSFLKQSNVFEMYGLDFMLDANLNLWFIECNSSPQLIGTNAYKTEFLKKMLLDMFDIEYKYFRSRMKRILPIIEKLYSRLWNNDKADISDLKRQFQHDIKNKLEPEYQLDPNNSFKLIIDKNLKGKAAYFGLLDEDCVDDIDNQSRFE